MLSRSMSRSATTAGGLLRPEVLRGHSSTGLTGGLSNGKVRMPRHRQTDSQQVRDAETFELEDLISEIDSDEGTISPQEIDRDVERA